MVYTMLCLLYTKGVRLSSTFFRYGENRQFNEVEVVELIGQSCAIEFQVIYRHPFVGDGFPVPRNSETCLGRDGKPVPYDAYTVGLTNSQFIRFLRKAGEHFLNTPGRLLSQCR